MLRDIKPKRGRTKGGGLTDYEKSIVKALLGKGYREQDITYIVNLGRITTVNPARINLIKKQDIKPASKDELEKYLLTQSSYDPKTLLNPYKDRDKRLICARETMILAVQLFNSPSVIFKTGTFCALANMAWTYIIHEKIVRKNPSLIIRKDGKTYSINEIFNRDFCPITEKPVIENLKKINDIRNHVEHEFFMEETKLFYALLQACCVNFERYIRDWFGDSMSLSQELSLALQFSRMNKDQIVELEKSNFPERIRNLYHEIETNEFADYEAFQMTIHYGLKNASKTNADIVNLVDYNQSGITNDTNKKIVIKKQRYELASAKDIIGKVKAEGFKKFGQHQHTIFWKTKWKDVKARNKDATDYGELITGRYWFWHEKKWLAEVLKYCKGKGNEFK